MSSGTKDLALEQRVDALARLVDTAARLLGGSPPTVEQGCELAARAWWLARPVSPGTARRLNATLHHLTRLQDERKPVPPGGRLAADIKLIFDSYSALAGGQSFVLVNDHDPKPLWYQFEAEYTGAYRWDYLEQGPEVWRVRIGKPAPSSSEGAAATA